MRVRESERERERRERGGRVSEDDGEYGRV